MLRRLGRLFVIKTRWEALAVIYALALGAVERGFHYMERFPGIGGWLMFAACTGVVFMAGAKLLDHTRREPVENRPDSGEQRLDTGARRRVADALPPTRPDPSGHGGDGDPAPQVRTGWLFEPQADGQPKEDRHGEREAVAAAR